MYGMEDIKRLNGLLSLSEGNALEDRLCVVDLSTSRLVKSLNLKKDENSSGGLGRLCAHVFYGYYLDKSLQCSAWGALPRPLSQ